MKQRIFLLTLLFLLILTRTNDISAKETKLNEDIFINFFVCKFSFLLIIHALKPPRFLVCDNLRKIFCKINPIKDIIRGDRNNVFCTRRKQRKGCPS